MIVCTFPLCWDFAHLLSVTRRKAKTRIDYKSVKFVLWVLKSPNIRQRTRVYCVGTFYWSFTSCFNCDIQLYFLLSIYRLQLLICNFKNVIVCLQNLPRCEYLLREPKILILKLCLQKLLKLTPAQLQLQLFQLSAPPDLSPTHRSSLSSLLLSSPSSPLELLIFLFEDLRNDANEYTIL